MKALIFFLAISAALFAFSGCAYKGAVFIYSPVGDGSTIDKTVSPDTNVGLK